MRPPEVLLDDFDTVYDYYRDHRQNRAKAWAAYAILARRFRPRVRCADGAPAAVRALLRSGRPVLIAVNHLSRHDPYTVAATAWRSPLRPIIGRVRVLAKDELFVEPKLRRQVDMMGAIPVFRGKDHGLRAVNAAGQRMMDICAERLARGDHLAVFPEGTCNVVDPSRVQPVGSGIGHIAFRARKLGAEPVLLSLALSYGPRPGDGTEPSKAEVVGSSFYFGLPITDLPTRPAEISRLVREDLQRALDAAVAAY